MQRRDFKDAMREMSEHAATKIDEHVETLSRLNKEQKKEILKYLAKRPYIEVAGLVAMIASLEPVKKEKGKQDNGKDKAQ